MVSGHFLSSLNKWKSDVRKARLDDDIADRLSHAVTSAILLVFAVAVSARQYMGEKPISCWVPAEFTSAQEEYAESACWVSSTYFLPTSAVSIPASPAKRREAPRILYYQWVPFILMLQALMFTLPCLVWRLLSWQTGIHLSTIIEVTADIERIRETELRHASLQYVSRYLDQCLRHQRTGRHHPRPGKDAHWCSHCSDRIKDCVSWLTCCRFWFSRRYGSYLTSLYLSTKIFYLANISLQFLLMRLFLDSPHVFYGLELLRHLLTGHSWEESGNFPRVTLCDFEVRKLANLHRYTVQCVLPINLFNEKIFLFLWFWFVLVAGVTLSSLVLWLGRLVPASSRVHFVRKFLKLRCLIGPADMKLTVDFTANYLQRDGVLVLRLMSHNIGDLITSEIVERIWRHYRGQMSNSSEIVYSNKQPRRSTCLYANTTTTNNNNNMYLANPDTAAAVLIRRRESSVPYPLHDDLIVSPPPPPPPPLPSNLHGYSSSSSQRSTDKSGSHHSGSTVHQQQRKLATASSSSNNNSRRAKRKIPDSKYCSTNAEEKNNLSLDNLEEDPGEFV